MRDESLISTGRSLELKIVYAAYYCKRSPYLEPFKNLEEARQSLQKNTERGYLYFLGLYAPIRRRCLSPDGGPVFPWVEAEIRALYRQLRRVPLEEATLRHGWGWGGPVLPQFPLSGFMICAIKTSLWIWRQVETSRRHPSRPDTPPQPSPLRRTSTPTSSNTSRLLPDWRKSSPRTIA